MDKFAWLTKLISLDTTSRNSNLVLIDCVQDWLGQYQIPVRLTYDATKEKANLFATISSKTNAKEGGIVLSGHTDVVPVDGQDWRTNPFSATRVDNKIYGRGASDMKSFLAVVLALVPSFQRLKLSKPIHLAFSYDEEVGCHGARQMIADFKKDGFHPAACIVGEPSNMQVVVAHKGIQAFRCRVIGRAAHSSLTPDGCNAIEYAAAAIEYIRNLAEQFKSQGPFDEHFDVPFTSITTNMITGGTAGNIIPATCEFIFEFRHLPEVDPKSIYENIKLFIQNELLPKMQNEYANATIEIEHAGIVPSFIAVSDSKISQIAQELSGDKVIHKVAYATEAGLFQEANIPTIICGPGSIEQAHKPDEFVTVEQLNKCEDFLRKVVQAF